MASHSAYEIAADDSDSDNEDLVVQSSAGLLPTHQVPSSQSKGKGRALSPTLPTHSTAGLEGRIGQGAGNVGERSQRQTTFGGIKTETRCV